MIQILVLALGVPTALAAASWATRRSWAPKAADTRGIALQTVIIIVVMLVIAGGVAGVLLTRADQVQADLAGVNTGIDPTSSYELCQSTARSLTGVSGLNAGVTAVSLTTTPAAAGFIANTGQCTVAGAAGAFSSTDCTSRGNPAGAFTQDADSVLCTFA